MRNNVIFDVSGECKCACVANVSESGNNTIVLAFEADSYGSPNFEIKIPIFDAETGLQSGDESVYKSLSIENGVAVGLFDWLEVFNVDNPPPYCNIRYVDGEKVGTWFEFSLSDTTIPLKMLELDYRTLRVDKTSTTTFSLYFVASEITPIVSANPDDFDVSDDGEISLKKNKDPDEPIETEELRSIDLTVKNELVDKVTFVYEKLIDGEPITDPDVPEEEKQVKTSYGISYNSNGDITKFGEIVVNWV